MTRLAEDHLGNMVPIMTDDSKREFVIGMLQKHGLRSFLETGTYQGAMVEAVQPYVDHVCTVELDVTNYNACAKRFSGNHKVHIWQGDSASCLPYMLDGAPPSLIWLDAHKSGDDSSGSHEANPLRVELQTIMACPVKHIVLVDDARFLGRQSWPSLDEIRVICWGRDVTLLDDVVRVV